MTTGAETDDLVDRPLFSPPRWAADDFTLWETGCALSERFSKPTKAEVARELRFREDRAASGERIYEEP